MSTTTASAQRLASEKQLYWIKKMGVEKGVTMLAPDDQQRVFAVVTDIDIVITARDASRILDDLFAAPTPKAADAVTEPGMYRVGETIYRVQESESGNLYAKRLVVTKHDDGKSSAALVYDSGAIREIRATHRMTRDEAVACGKDYGICVVCGSQLEDPKSVARGIGPTCAKRV